MSLFAWANKQFESLSDKLAPLPTDPAHRFSKACSSKDTNLALQLISQNPPPLPDGTHTSPLDPFNTVISGRGTLPIHCASVYAQASVVQTLIAQYGVPAEQFDEKGNTPLHYAAFSKDPSALTVVKMLVNDYNVSVTIKNADGKTPYDVSLQDSIRQFLLPIQLQRETQECLDNGGQGLPQGIDMGGMTVSKAHLAPPPMGGMGSPPPMGGSGANAYSGGMSASKYAAPTYGNEQPPAAAPTMNSYNPAPAGGNEYSSQVASHPAMGVTPNMYVAQPTQPAMPVGNNAAFSPAAAQPVVDTATNVSVGTPAFTPAAFSPTSAGTPAATSVPAVSEPSSVSPQEPVETTPAVVESIPSAVQPIIPATNTPVYSPAVNGATMNPIAGSTSAPNAGALNVIPTNPTANANTTAPSSSGSAYARGGYSSAAVGFKSRYKNDGFHSSSSDVSLQKKYGHDASITGPPSGQFASSNIGPPPSSGNAPATSNVGSSSLPAGYSNPYAGGVAAAMARPRYPTYDAVSGSVGTAPTGHYQNPYATQQAPPAAQYNVYTPSADYNQQPQQQQPAYDVNQQYGYGNQQQQAQQPVYDNSHQYGYGNQSQQAQQPTYDYNQQMQYQQPQQQAYGYGQQPQQQQQPAAYEPAQSVPIAQQPTPGYAANTTTQNQAVATNTNLQQSQTENTMSPAVQPQTQTAATTAQAVTQSVQNVTSPVAAVSAQVQTLNIGGVQSETQPQPSATALFGSPSAVPAVGFQPEVKSTPVIQQEIIAANNADASAADLFGSPRSAAAATASSLASEPLLVAPAKAASAADGFLSPPPITSGVVEQTPETEPAVANVNDPATAPLSDFDLPPPPFGLEDTDANDLDQSGDDLPPPPMMDIPLFS